MKKVFLMEFAYLKDAEGIAESFGTTPEELSNVSAQMMKLGCKDEITKKTTSLMELIESGEITGGQVLALTTMQLADTQEKAMIHFLKTLMKGKI